MASGRQALAFACLVLALAVQDTAASKSGRRRRDPAEVDAWWVLPLKPVVYLRSARQRSERAVTLAIHYTSSRLSVLEAQCALWTGVISAAVYIPLLNGTVYQPGDASHGLPPGHLVWEITELYNRLQPGNCTLDLGVYTEDLPERSDSPSGWYRFPVNAMRNVALQQAETDIVGFLDADFVVGSQSFVHGLQDPVSYDRLAAVLRDKRAAVILPAWETAVNTFGKKSNNSPSDSELADATRQVLELAASENRGALLADAEKKTVVPFHGHFHRFTDYTRWKRGGATPAGGGTYYKITYPSVTLSVKNAVSKEFYEPYALLWREHVPVPLWDERFRGYHLNKIQGLVYLDFEGFDFYVHPEAFILHVPHRGASKDAREKEMKSAKIGAVNAVWNDEFRNKKKEGSYIPVAFDHSDIRTAPRLYHS